MTVAADFHRLYYDAHRSGGTWADTSWLGVSVQKCPLDLWIYQEILHEIRPALIVETGTASGGSALFLASICDLLGKGRVVSVDIADPAPAFNHKRITWVAGSSSTSPGVARFVHRLAYGSRPVLVILDSDHHQDHVADELRLYSPLVTPGSYLIVEDTNVNGHPVEPRFGPGPAEAVAEFCADHDDFAVDASREKLLLSFNPGGYLRRTR